MSDTPILIGNSPCHARDGQVGGEYSTLLGETCYCIRNYDHMPPFFMSIVSSSDHWLFISSSGGLTAGRVNADSALFPYETVDRVTESTPHTGPLSIFLVTQAGKTRLWEPFSGRCASLYPLERRLYKNISGDKVVFEERNLQLGLTCRRAWRTSERFGFVLTTWLANHSRRGVSVRLLSGVQNLLPYGVNARVQSNFSNLLNAYKRSELDPDSGLGIFSLSAALTDKAEPSESLQATTAWQTGLEAPTHLLSSLQVETFRCGKPLSPERDIRGQRGAYLLAAGLSLEKGETRGWSLVLELNQDGPDIAALRSRLKTPPAGLAAEIEADIAAGTQKLDRIIASADGLQYTGDVLGSAHHYANVLFNTLRGGVFAGNYRVSKEDFRDFLQVRHPGLLQAQAAFLEALPADLEIDDLLARASHWQSPNLERLCYEYLPLTFSRRHGDPSRPWNRFSINIKNPDGSRRLDYQGNWRDIFQNWEPLACSFPEFVESMIAKFVNAVTPDGYNPYRLTRAGIEWEVPEPDNPWANIGYWSDHQVIYLQKLLEISARFHPGRLETMLTRPVFSWADVPYRQRDYTSLLGDIYNTIDFDHEAHLRIEERAAGQGSDGKLVHLEDGSIYHVNLGEKLLVLLLAKLVNFVPEGGLWMNTQRPEWNDANNALVGKGLSVVTLGYLRRFVVFFRSLLEGAGLEHLEFSRELVVLFEALRQALTEHQPCLDSSFSDQARRAVMDALGQAGSRYRLGLYREGFSGQKDALPAAELTAFLGLALAYLEHTLRANRREDGLYHAYNILKIGRDSASVGCLDEMLEGQVSILSSGLLTPEEARTLLAALRESALYRPDQHSYLLYPDRRLPAFLEKNRLPAGQVEKLPLVKALAAAGDRSLLVRDENGDYHFNGRFRNAGDVERALEQLGRKKEFAGLAASDGERVLALFEEHFRHEAFTGRSGTFFAYEGLGSIYWHMVSKLLLAAQENARLALEQGAEPETTAALQTAYYDIRRGLGFNKPPRVYGAFPTDPYSHTPAGQGAKQPGMTGQVKEEILTRLAELGLFVEGGQIRFDPRLLRPQEFNSAAGVFDYYDPGGEPRQLDLPAGSLAFTFCQTPVVYQQAQAPGLEVHYAGGRLEQASGDRLGVETSRHIFRRDCQVEKVVLKVNAASLSRQERE